ncbi:MAG TPA: hypothetical protein GX699_07700 [Firmicutes bacterium]|nr:hypothetical protein [Bacillota bacterium]
MKSKWRRHISIFLCIFALCGVALWGAWQIWFDPYRGTVATFRPTERLKTVLSASQAVEDLDYLVQRLAERHPACINGLPDKVHSAYEQEREKIALSPEVPVLALWQSAARILNSLGDAHTTVGVNYENGVRLPLSFTSKKDALLCSGGEYEGYTVIEIGGVPIGDLYERFLAQFSYELEAWAHHSFASRLNRSEYLSFVGVNTRGEVPLVLESPGGGDRITVAYELRENVIADTGRAAPGFEYSFHQPAGVGIFTLRKCVYDEQYKAGLQEFFTKVQEQNIRSVIVDVRGNPGGNSLVAREFIRYLPAEDYLAGTSEVRLGPILWKNKPQTQKNVQLPPLFLGDVYVLTGTDTFSAAMDFAVLISDNGLGLVIGESPGNMPSSYGDILRFQTPNAGLVFTVSYKHFVRPDSSKSDRPLLPDVAVPAEDALEEAMRLIGKTR